MLEQLVKTERLDDYLTSRGLDVQLDQVGYRRRGNKHSSWCKEDTEGWSKSRV